MVKKVVAASLLECREAWLDSSKLEQWLAESAVWKGDVLALVSCVPNIGGRHQLMDSKVNSLEFLWYVDGCETQLTVEFVECENTTEVTVRHVFPERLPRGVQFPGGEHYGEQSWRFVLDQLQAYLEDGERSMSLPWPLNPHVIELEVKLEASISAVWGVLTTVEKMRETELVMGEASIDLKVGGRYSFGWVEDEAAEEDGPGYITQLENEKELAHTWYGGRDSEIIYRLDKVGDSQTHLSFQHTGLIFPIHEVWSYQLGWADHLLQLKKIAEVGA